MDQNLGNPWRAFQPGWLPLEHCRSLLRSRLSPSTVDEISRDRRIARIQIPEGLLKTVRARHGEQQRYHRQRHGFKMLNSNDPG